MVEDSLSGEVSDEDEVAEIDEDNLHRESVRHRVKVGSAQWYNFLVSDPDSLLYTV